MKLNDLLSIVDAQGVHVSDREIYDREFSMAFATDLMSDALAFCKDDNEETIFLTSLTNVQALRTAEVLDLSLVLFVSGKPIDQQIINTAKMLDINIFQTQIPMFEVCGLLFKAGIL